MVSVMLYLCIFCVDLLMDLFVLCVACLTVFVNCLGVVVECYGCVECGRRCSVYGLPKNVCVVTVIPVCN